MKTFRDYHPDQGFLLPPNPRDWLPEGHVSLFLSDVIDHLDMGCILAEYEKGDGRGQPPYHPRMMFKLLVYGYATGKRSSRKIQEATYTDVAFRVLAGGQHPDHASISEFRRRHLKHIAELFLKVLELCSETGLVKLGNVALDGTKMKASASKHKAMSYERMCQTEKRLQEEIDALLKQAEEVDTAEDARYGKEGSGTELPEELKRRESRLAKIREAKAALEEAAREKARQDAAAAQAKIEERERQEQETGVKAKGAKPKVVDPETAVPDPKAQRNFTDPESRIMKDGATKSFEQAYNAHVAVDEHAQIILAARVTQEANDKQQLVPTLKAVEENTGHKPKAALADAGFLSEAAVTDPALEGIDLYVAVSRQEHNQESPPAEGEAPEDSSVREKMRHKLQTEAGKKIYALRKSIVEPVFGQTKAARGIREFLLRGLEKVEHEWELICLAHNLLKLYVCTVRTGGYAKASQVRAEGAVAVNAA